MKITTSLTINALILTLIGCASSGPSLAQQCPAIPKLKIDDHTLDYSENKAICVRKDQTFKIKLKPQNDFVIIPADITVAAKEGPGTIEKVEVTANNRLVVQVSGYDVGTQPGFAITVAKVGTLDPRVVIIRDYAYLGQAFINLENELLEDYGLSFDSLLAINSELGEKEVGEVDSLAALIKALEAPEPIEYRE